MAGTKISALPAGTLPVAVDVLPMAQGGATNKVSGAQLRQWAGTLSGASTLTVTNGYTLDTYLAGSAVTIPTAGGWKAGTLYGCVFDMTKTAFGTAGFTVTVRMGTLGAIGDASILVLTFGAGTAAVDTGLFELLVTFRSVGAGTAAVVQGLIQCTHHLAATGLTTTGASGTGIILGTSAGFNSTTQTVIGISVLGGNSFQGTNTLVQATAINV